MELMKWGETNHRESKRELTLAQHCVRIENIYLKVELSPDELREIASNMEADFEADSKIPWNTYETTFRHEVPGRTIRLQIWWRPSGVGSGKSNGIALDELGNKQL